MTSSSDSMTASSVPKTESITIVSARTLSPLIRAKENLSEEDFIELRVVRKSPKKIEIKKIKREVKPTKGFREAIEKAGLLDTNFD